MRILIVDDENGKKVEWIKEILKEKNIEYEQSLNFNEAYEKILSGNIDGIILDMNFSLSEYSESKGREGIMLLKKIKHRNMQIPIIGNSTIRFPTSNEYPFLKGQLDGYETIDGRNTLIKFLESIEEQS